MKNLPAFLLLCVLILISCKSDTKTSTVVKSPFDYRAYLLKNQGGVTTIAINDFEGKNVLNQLKNGLDSECLGYLNFNSITKNGIISSLAMDYCENMPSCNRGFGVTAIFTNQYEVILDGQLMSKEDLNNLDITDYLNAFGRKDCHLSIIKDDKVHQEQVNAFLQYMILAYLRHAEILSENKFQQPLKDLNLQQLDSIKAISTFNLHFVEYIIPPPPPPAYLKENL